MNINESRKVEFLHDWVRRKFLCQRGLVVGGVINDDELGGGVQHLLDTEIAVVFYADVCGGIAVSRYGEYFVFEGVSA